ncbi:peptide deformylase [Helcococcus massiliensis]|uniref:peptide deformylase n=1 Tax=Helcococcus massiliensis TaxID=2040290 RepID=UPI000CDF1EF2|nr:peptide deformylase [Helcococcus massiliensis]
MSLRVVRLVPDEILNKKARPVKKIDERIKQLLNDMVNTMRENNGIGLAGPQVGVLRRLFVIDLGEDHVYKVINPEILERKGSDIDIEGCLSIPNFQGTVERAEWIKAKYTDENGQEQIIEADGLLAKCFQHEYDHLDGILITSKYIEEVTDDNIEEIRERLAKDKGDEIAEE